MLVTGLALIALLTAGCSSSDDSDGASASDSVGGGTAIAATVKDFELTVDPTTAPTGEMNFTITNDGPSAHEFVVVKTDTAPDALPVTDGLVDEDGITVVDEAEDIAPSTTATLDVDLEAGSYVIICNIAGHYEQGMHEGFTVS